MNRLGVDVVVFIYPYLVDSPEPLTPDTPLSNRGAVFLHALRSCPEVACVRLLDGVSSSSAEGNAWIARNTPPANGQPEPPGACATVVYAPDVKALDDFPIPFTYARLWEDDFAQKIPDAIADIRRTYWQS